MLSIHDYLLQDERKTPKLLLQWTGMIVFIIIFLAIMNQIISFNSYYQCQGVAKNGYLSIYVLTSDLSKIVNGEKIYIDDIAYEYSVNEVKEDVISNGTNYYQEILINVDLRDRDFMNNSVVDVKFIIEERTILTYIIHLIKGEK